MRLTARNVLSGYSVPTETGGIHVEQFAGGTGTRCRAILRGGLETTGEGLASTMPQSGPEPCVAFPLYLARRVEAEARPSNLSGSESLWPEAAVDSVQQVDRWPMAGLLAGCSSAPPIRSRATQYLLAAVIGFVPTQ